MKVYFPVIISCIIEFTFAYDYGYPARQTFHGESLATVEKLLNTTGDTIVHSEKRVELAKEIHNIYSSRAAFEIGYYIYFIQEKYRKMVDRYNVSITKPTGFFMIEHITFLYEIETLYWELTHITNMVHEVERKHNIKYPPDRYPQGIYVDPVYRDLGVPWWYKTKGTRKRRLKKPQQRIYEGSNIAVSPPKMQNLSKLWPINYGWELEDDW